MFCAHKLIAIKPHPLHINRQKVVNRIWILSVIPTFIPLCIFTRYIYEKNPVAYAFAPTLFLALAIVGYLLTSKINLRFIIYWTVALVALPIYRKFTLGTVTENFTDLAIIGVSSLVQVILLSLIIFIYESFIQNRDIDPDKNWSSLDNS